MKKVLEEFGIVSTALQNSDVIFSDALSLLYITCDKYKEWLSTLATEDGVISLLKPALEICNTCGIDTTGAGERQKKGLQGMTFSAAGWTLWNPLSTSVLEVGCYA